MTLPKFLTRVELHGARPDDYARLHEAMKIRNFHNTIADDNGVAFQLPTAMYVSHGPAITVTQVRDLAVQAAKSTGLQHWVLVSEYNASAWVLRPISPISRVARVLGGG